MHIFLWSVIAEAEPTSAWQQMRPVVLIMGILFVGFFLWVATWRRVRRSQRRSQRSVKERLAEAVPGRVICSQIDELMAALADLSRQINGQIDTRLARLEILLQEADEAIAELAGPSGSESSTTQTAERTGQGAASESIKSLSEQFHQQGVSGADSPESREILAMVGEGLSAVQIAQRLNRPVGEIELILALNEKRGPQDG